VSQTGPLAMRRVLAADATYLKSSFSLKLYNLATRRVISRLRLTPLPVSDAVIHAVETIAKSEGQGSLKITSPGGNVINDSRLNAGVSHHKYDTDNATNEENDNDEDDCTNVDIETIHPEYTKSYGSDVEEHDDDNENIVLLDDEDDCMPEYALEPEQNEPTMRRSERLHVHQ
jgi:hypothetical protein